MTTFFPTAAKFLFLTVLSSGAVLGSDLKTISDLLGERFRNRILIGKLSNSDFSKLALEFLAPQPITLGRIVVYGSTRARVIAGPLGYDHCGYETWRSLINGYDRDQLGCPEVHEAVRIGPNIIVRTLDRNCDREGHLLRGQVNPLHTVVAGTKIEILDLSLGGGPSDDRIGASFFVRTQGAVTEEIARGTALHMRALTGISDLTVTVRSDIWFFNACGFPAFYPFEELQFPSRAQYLRTKYAVCSGTGAWPIQCFVSTSR